MDPDALPRENLFRTAACPELRAADGEGGPVMVGHFAVFDQWTEINSGWEGNFLERFVKGAFRKTIKDNRDGMRVLFQHGFDPQIGDKPLGPIADLREEDEGAWYEVPLLDAPYVRHEILPGLEAGLYGASFRFRVLREEIVEEPGASDHNPNGLPERTVKEAKVMEFGPVTFPAYAGASAGVRSITDELLLASATPERRRELAEFLARDGTARLAEEQEEQDPAQDDAEQEQAQDDAPRGSAEEQPHPAPNTERLYGLGRQDRRPPWAL